jgi:hypothetical protein
MADFVAVLKKTIDGLDEANPEVRRKVYDKARATIAAKLAQMNPPPPAAVAERQKRTLEEAIGKVEAEYNAAEAGNEESPDELEAIFASLSDPKPRAASTPVEPAALANRAPRNPAVAAPSALSGAQRSPAPARAPQPATSARPPAAEPRKQPPEFDTDSLFMDPVAGDTFAGEIAPPSSRTRRGAGLLLTLLAFVVIAGAAYGAWFKREDIASALGVRLPEFARVSPSTPKAPAKKEVAIANPAPGTAKAPDTKPAVPQPQAQAGSNESKQDGAATPASAPAAPSAAQKFTQRLANDGTETNPGPAAGETKVGEGTSVAAVTPAAGGAVQTGQAAPAAPATDTDKAQVPVGQRAIFYEERTNTEQGSANTGTVVWSLVKESPGGDLPAEAAIRGEMNIPARNLQLRITIRRNGDKTLPASHIVELIFLTPDNFEGGGIDSVLRMAMKVSEQAPGNPVIGIPAKIADGYFLLALNDGKAEIETNTTLLRRESWIDIPIVYKSGRRALVTLEKGIPGDKVFDEALSAWEQTPIGQEATPAPAGDNGSGDANKPAPAGGTNG